MKYKIEISYQTGNSFGIQDETEILGEWENLDIAKENLQAIKEHYKLYKEEKSVKSYRQNNKLNTHEVISKYKDNWWFVGKLAYFEKWNKARCRVSKKDYDKNPDKYIIEYEQYISCNIMNLKADNGNFYQIGCFWCGYFETLYGGKIITEENDI